MKNPYHGLPAKAFWKFAVAEKSMFDVDQLWDPAFLIKQDHKVVTFGSCFAQHIGRAMSDRGFSWISTESAPPALSKENARRFNYDIFSCRTGNLYTTSLLLQWTRWAVSNQVRPAEVWEKDGRFYDPFRPAIEPNGFLSPQELVASRDVCIKAFRKCIETADLFVFTLGLTESWKHIDGYEYPLCPGTHSGVFNDAQHLFVNQDFLAISDSLMKSIDLMRTINKNLKFILTVSPVPLTATNSGKHVVVATMESKSVLRAVAGHVSAKMGDVDYFPSYELINSPVFKGAFFEPNQRSVNHHGVDFVMNSFFAALRQKYEVSEDVRPVQRSEASPDKSDADVVCEEELLGAFGGRE